MTYNSGITLIEILVVIILIGILAAAVFPQFTKSLESGLDSEANSTLRLIRQAENFYRMEEGSYVNCSDIDTLNSRLKLSIPNVTSRKWNYKVTSATGTSFMAVTKRNGYDNRTRCINESVDEPFSTGCSW